ncbi:MerR family transcriptional regulator [Geobacter hydrogenophilus]|uniref:MerR family transcriptional regulator n=1 Tax=Geobacter hydrogenophilus TaxID=40983 RepID=A0A9W6L9J3_9BACT|nr:MerR family transcriptional regulator [Geobacter hydrogenophilus]MBT0895235.1 MerR family transcriptional regulator [Geobacter hydrogenophilus]GLI36583.1 MerR family transcriptional regulator [Geobacter hydrogenophilus]
MEAKLPDKQYFRIGEVARLTALKTSVLRFWETEFKDLSPPKSRTGQRLYTKQDIELLLEIKRLLYVDKLTIEGARKKLKATSRSGETTLSESKDVHRLLSLVKEVRDELETIRLML